MISWPYQFGNHMAAEPKDVHEFPAGEVGFELLVHSKWSDDTVYHHCRNLQAPFIKERNGKAHGSQKHLRTHREVRPTFFSRGDKKIGVTVGLSPFW